MLSSLVGRAVYRFDAELAEFIAEEIEVAAGAGKNRRDRAICHGLSIIKAEFESGGKFHFLSIGQDEMSHANRRKRNTQLALISP